MEQPGQALDGLEPPQLGRRHDGPFLAGESMGARLDGKTALVTGATSNIGRAIALAFGAQAAHVIAP